jgi:hypothetical protein
MARIDLQKYFNQLPLHRDDWKMLGVRLPKDFSLPDQDLEEWVSAYAQFGGKPFPAYANAIMSAVATILRGHGIDVVFMTDDLFLCAASLEECKALLNKAVDILTQLGLKLQPEKIIQPSQVMPFLGITIDTIQQRLSIAQEKLISHQRTIRHILSDSLAGTLLAKDLESLIGKLGWVTRS